MESGCEAGTIEIDNIEAGGTIVAELRIVVANNTRATFYRWEAERSTLRQTKVIGNSMGRQREGDVRSDAPGRVMNRLGGVRHAYQQHQTAKDHARGEFARAIAREIARQPSEARIVLVAAPRMLSALRKPLPKLIADRVVGALERDLVGMPRALLRSRILDFLSETPAARRAMH